MIKKITAVILSILLAATCLSTVAFATDKSSSDGAAWATARANEGWCKDVDGCYGCQCVDLILAYYDYLGVSRVSGNACDYASNALPSGWTRVYSNPQPGDIVVWGPYASLAYGGYAAGSVGHIGIVTGVPDSSHINTVETNTYEYGSAAHTLSNRYSTTASCFIRPNWGSSGSSDTWTTEVKDITDNDAYITSRITPPSRTQFTACGIRIYDVNDNLLKEYRESSTVNYSYMIIFYDIKDEVGYTLRPGTTYKYQIFATYGGTEHWSPVWSFTTTGTSTPVYTVKFDANGGSGSMENLSCTYGVSANLTSNAFTRKGYKFNKWNTKADGSGTSYSNGASICNLTNVDGAVVTLYAQWTQLKYTVKFNANGGTGTMSALTGKVYGKYFYLTKNTFTRSGYTFAGWNTKADGSGKSLKDHQKTRITSTSSTTITLYAQWTPIKYNVAFNANGGTGTMETLQVSYGSYFRLTDNTFTRSGYKFIAWNTKADGSGTWFCNYEKVRNFTKTSGRTITLYAIWKKK